MNDDFSTIMNRLSENARIALQKADLSSKRYNKGYVGTEHLLLGLASHEICFAAEALRRGGVEVEDIEDALGSYEQDISTGDIAMMSLSEPTILTLRIAAEDSRNSNLDFIGTGNLLRALIAQKKSRAYLLLQKIIGAEAMKDFIKLLEGFYEAAVKHNPYAANTATPDLKRKPSGRWLMKYGRNLNMLAAEDQIDSVIGRDAEIERVITILSRRSKSNPVLIGEAGVGKTAIAEGLAKRIIRGEVPSFLIQKEIFQVDLSTLVAGTKFRGDFEERLKGVIDDVSAMEDIILFIDELHLLVGAGSGEGSMDAANILKPALARNNLQLIGATTLDEYRRLEKDKALARRFQTVYVEEPSPANTLKILKGVKKRYENHHGVTIPATLLNSIINMSTRYIADRFMPDKAIDVLDEASAFARVLADKDSSSAAYRRLLYNKERTDQMLEMLKHIENPDKDIVEEVKTLHSVTNRCLKDLEPPKTPDKIILNEDHIAHAIAQKTGIPVSKVHGSEAKLLTNLETRLKKSIIGQDDAIQAVAKSIRRGRSGIADPRRPIGSFIFLGPTGVGKTELAKVIAEEVFGGENALIKLDMSEYAEKHNVARLFGAPAGYVGYEEGGKLTEAVRRRPYSVVLFDEIEKAHPEVFNILLQVLEDGVLTDGLGNKVRFNNTIIILTSNLGATELNQESELGFALPSTEKLSIESNQQRINAIAHRALKRHVRPELLGRLDSILVFHPLTRSGVDKIFKNLLQNLKKRLALKKVSLILTDAAQEHLIDLGFSPKLGARPLRRAIEDHLESLISESLIAGALQSGSIALIDCHNKKLTLQVYDESTLPSIFQSASRRPRKSSAKPVTKSSPKSVKSSKPSKPRKSPASRRPRKPSTKSSPQPSTPEATSSPTLQPSPTKIPESNSDSTPSPTKIPNSTPKPNQNINHKE